MDEGDVPKRGGDLSKIGLRDGVDILIENGVIREIFPSGRYGASDVDAVFSAEGLTALPGLVDSHTHSVFFGSRVDEFYERTRGKTYLEILESGGGILSTVKSVRNASYNDIEAFSSGLMDSFIENGTTTVEIKSGYGLTEKDEIKMLEVISNLSKKGTVDTVPTFLGAHALPDEYKNKKDAYVDLVAEKMIPQISQNRLAKYCDVFCEKGAFSVSDARKIAESAVGNGLRMKFHSEQFTRSGTTDLAVEFGASSVDHCIEMNEQDIEKLSKTDTVMILLPGSELVLNQNKFAPARKAIEGNCVVALATDFNPGSCPIQSLWLIGSLAVLKMAMSFEEVLNSITVNAAYSAGIQNRAGMLKEGLQADIIFVEAPYLNELFYFVGSNPVKIVVKNGKVIRSVL